MPRASAVDAALTAERILDAASKCFTAHGFHGSSMEQIARTAGVTRGAVYHHFDDKVGVLRAVVRAGHQRVASHIADHADDAQGDARALLRAGCHAFIDGITQDDAAQVILIDGPAVLGWTEWRALDAASSMQELQEAIALLAPPTDVEALTRLLSGAMNEGVLWIIEYPDDPNVRAAVHRALDQLIDAVGAPFTCS